MMSCVIAWKSTSSEMTSLLGDPGGKMKRVSGPRSLLGVLSTIVNCQAMGVSVLLTNFLFLSFSSHQHRHSWWRRRILEPVPVTSAIYCRRVRAQKTPGNYVNTFGARILELARLKARLSRAQQHNDNWHRVPFR